MTTITFKVPGCNGCAIGAQGAIESGNPNDIQPPTPDYWHGVHGKVRNGRVALKVPTDELLDVGAVRHGHQLGDRRADGDD
jgi:hypothetical protein